MKKKGHLIPYLFYVAYGVARCIYSGTGLQLLLVIMPKLVWFDHHSVIVRVFANENMFGTLVNVNASWYTRPHLYLAYRRLIPMKTRAIVVDTGLRSSKQAQR